MISSTHSSDNSNAYANAVGLTSFFISSINYVFTKPWILDNGATDHITCDFTLLIYPLALEPQSLPLAPYIQFKYHIR
jgi:hypothetical protein